jgi:hypothetical protein
VAVSIDQERVVITIGHGGPCRELDRVVGSAAPQAGRAAITEDSAGGQLWPRQMAVAPGIENATTRWLLEGPLRSGGGHRYNSTNPKCGTAQPKNALSQGSP